MVDQPHWEGTRHPDDFASARTPFDCLPYRAFSAQCSSFAYRAAVIGPIMILFPPWAEVPGHIGGLRRWPQVPRFRLSRVYQSETIDRRILEVVKGGNYILGPECKEFEKELAAYFGVPHVVSQLVLDGRGSSAAHRPGAQAGR